MTDTLTGAWRSPGDWPLAIVADDRGWWWFDEYGSGGRCWYEPQEGRIVLGPRKVYGAGCHGPSEEARAEADEFREHWQRLPLFPWQCEVETDTLTNTEAGQ